MAKKFRNRYRIESTRLPGWDYGNDGAYFVTICTHHRYCFFGDVAAKKVRLSDLGNIVQKCWHEIPDHFPFVELGESVVMPNHVHGIIIINKKRHEPQKRNDGDNMVETPKLVETPNLGVSTTNASKKWKPGILGVIINQYKRACTIQCRKINPEFGWQSRFHDRIIRDYQAYVQISQYIINNPLKWNLDKFHK